MPKVEKAKQDINQASRDILNKVIERHDPEALKIGKERHSKSVATKKKSAAGNKLS